MKEDQNNDIESIIRELENPVKKGEAKILTAAMFNKIVKAVRAPIENVSDGDSLDPLYDLLIYLLKGFKNGG